MDGKVLRDVDATIDYLTRPDIDLERKVRVATLALRLVRGHMQPLVCGLADLATEKGNG